MLTRTLWRDDARVPAQLRAGVARAREREHVLRAEVVEQVADASRRRTGSAPSGSSSRLHHDLDDAPGDAAPCGVPGFSITGMPARSAHAAFSAIPHAGKLKALTCTATPCARHAHVLARRSAACGRAATPSPSASKRCVAELLAELGVGGERARSRRRCRTSRRRACCRRSAIASSISSSRCSWIARRRRLSSSPRSANVSARSAGPPLSRAYASAAREVDAGGGGFRERLRRWWGRAGPPRRRSPRPSAPASSFRSSSSPSPSGPL